MRTADSADSDGRGPDDRRQTTDGRRQMEVEGVDGRCTMRRVGEKIWRPSASFGLRLRAILILVVHHSRAGWGSGGEGERGRGEE
jgi:hypothetical protein